MAVISWSVPIYLIPYINLHLSATGVFLYLRPYHNPWIKKAKKLLGCAQDFRLENWILVEWIDKTQTLPKLSLENLGRVCVLPIHSTTFQFSNLKSWAHPYNFFAFLIHGLWFGRSYKNRPVEKHFLIIFAWVFVFCFHFSDSIYICTVHMENNIVFCWVK